MTDLTVSAKNLSGKITLPPFKSEAIRSLLFAALSGNKPTNVVRLPDRVCDDIAFAITSSSALYNAIKQGCSPKYEVGESATLLRLLIPCTLALFGEGEFILNGNLHNRGLTEFKESLDCEIHYDGLHLSVKGSMRPRNYYVPSIRSSQFASGILTALPLIPSASLEVSSIVSRQYFELTKLVASKFGISFNEEKTNSGSIIKTSGVYCSPHSFVPESDSSYAANFIAANFMGCDVEFTNYPHSLIQADMHISDLLGKSEIDVINCPDLFPILCVVACSQRQEIVIKNISRLRTKESDRVAAMFNGLSALGASVALEENRMIINGTGFLKGGVVHSYNDHRIIMAYSIASLIASSPITIIDTNAVSKSAPFFFDDFKKLGGMVN